MVDLPKKAFQVYKQAKEIPIKPSKSLNTRLTEPLGTHQSTLGAQDPFLGMLSPFLATLPAALGAHR